MLTNPQVMLLLLGPHLRTTVLDCHTLCLYSLGYFCCSPGNLQKSYSLLRFLLGEALDTASLTHAWYLSDVCFLGK